MSGKTYRRVMAVISLLLLAVLGALFVYDNERQENGVVLEITEQAQEQPGGSFLLTNHKGEKRSSKALDADYKVIFFGFTSCPDVCPAALQKLSLALEMLDEEAATELSPVFITVDPARDTPDVIAAYLSNFHPRFTGFTGSAEDIKAVQERYRVYAERAENSGGEYLMDHSSYLYVTDRNDRLLEVISADMPVPDLATALQAVQGRS